MRTIPDKNFLSKFSNEIKSILSLNEKDAVEITENTEKIYVYLKNQNKNSSKTFEYIKKFAVFIKAHKGENFMVRISRKKFADASLYMIEPPCGSNTYIFDSNNELFFVDCGFACFEKEMLLILKQLFPGFEKRKKELFLTHCDIDHAGLCHIFDTVYATQKTYENFELEKKGEKNFRKQYEHHEAYNRIAEIISDYKTPELKKIKTVEENIYFNNIVFKVIKGEGGHIPGEAILLWEKEKVSFCGDIFVNHKGYSEEQAYFNSLAPYLTKSVNVNSEKARVSRETVLKNFADYLICPGHGKWV